MNITKKIHVSIFLFLLLSVYTVNAQKEELDVTVPSITNEKIPAITDSTHLIPATPIKWGPYPSLLWQITSEETTDTSYLFGTMHSTNERVHQVGDTVVHWLHQCDAVALELDMDEVNPFGMIKAMMMKDTKLKDLYENEEDYKKVKKYAKEKLGLMTVIFNVEKIKPLYTATLLSEMENVDIKGAAGRPNTLDMRLEKLGKANDKVVIGIETAEEQLGAIDEIPLSEQAKMLLAMTEDKDKKKNTMNDLDEMVTVYTSQNLDSLLAFYENQKEDLPGNFEEALLTKRNYTMAHRVDSLLHLRSTFVAVGAMHLPGEHGLIELLRERGYEVQAIRCKKED